MPLNNGQWPVIMALALSAVNAAGGNVERHVTSYVTLLPNTPLLAGRSVGHGQGRALLAINTMYQYYLSRLNGH